MKIFLDTANVDEISKWLNYGVLDGVTTNPSILLKEGGSDMEGRVREIANLINPKPLSVEVFTNDPDEMMIELPITMNVSSGCGDAGDLNGDGEVSILDIIAMINCILHDECPDCSDLNGDNMVNIQDIITLINIILN